MKTLTLSILQFNTFVKNILDAEEFLCGIGVYGEVTNFKISGGNAYFDLKDESASLSCVKFGAGDLDIKNGDLVTVYGKVNFYVKSGRLNFLVARVELSGLGKLYEKFLLLKSKLEAEGLFREDIKKQIPKYANCVAVVTSETGAVIHDIIHVARAKNPYTNILLYPSKVQGDGADEEIIAGLKYFDQRDDVDTIIIARGGGSMEDLSPFNSEKLVREIFKAKKPIISAVGHETDFTLCDFVADLRVPTPSVAGEIAFFNYYEECENINSIANSINYYVSKIISNEKLNLKVASSEIIDKTKLKIVEFKNSVSESLSKIKNSVELMLLGKKSNLDKVCGIISKLNPLDILRNGYGVIERNGSRVMSIKDVGVNESVKVILSDGELTASVTEKKERL